MSFISDSHTTRVLRVQSQVDEVIDVMQENISKVIERGERLDDLQDKSGESHQNSKPTGNVLFFWFVLVFSFHRLC